MFLWVLLFMAVLAPPKKTHKTVTKQKKSKKLERPLYRTDEGENYTKLRQDFDHKMQLMEKDKDQDLQYVGVLLWLAQTLQHHFKFMPGYFLLYSN